MRSTWPSTRVDVVRHEQHGGAGLAAVPVDEPDDGLLVREVEARERLVAQQQPRIVGERLTDAQPLLLAAREQPDRVVGEVAARRRRRSAGRRARARRGAGTAARTGARRRRAPRGRGRAAPSRAAAVAAAGCSRCAGCRAPRTSSPSARMLPSLSGSSPRIARSSVVLPDPLGPSTATSSPGSTVRSSPLHSSRSPRRRRGARDLERRAAVIGASALGERVDVRLHPREVGLPAGRVSANSSTGIDCRLGLGDHQRGLGSAGLRVRDDDLHIARAQQLQRFEERRGRDILPLFDGLGEVVGRDVHETRGVGQIERDRLGDEDLGAGMGLVDRR